ncbi:glycosyltransferase [Nocardia sp. SYP-A9097]|uniref:glycosyltransferase family 2 protein n=1 Tax=Nocardia sp. SYP-A9097 TaxID=2663237 RepID=UPI00129AB304|nr:glycosyltransferase [Nocardia sp. SYP-A9097]MRH87663.1 glycosyltransferase [Nocardia sp. SYP-A9097]
MATLRGVGRETRSNRSVTRLPFENTETWPRTTDLDADRHAKATVTGEILDGVGDSIGFRHLEGRRRRAFTIALSALSLGLGGGYVVWLIDNGLGATDKYERFGAIAIIMVTLVVTVEAIRFALVMAMSMTTALARKPVPIRARPGLNVALLITFVPKSEDIAVLERTLIAARQVRHRQPGVFDVYVLDEGDPEQPARVRALVDEVNRGRPGNRVHYLTRGDKPGYHQKRGPFETRTKFGNINAGLDMIRNTPELPDYDVVMGIDPDHKPMPEFGERMLGYFNDPDVAYVAGPQAYANATDNVVAKLAESQQFVFHSLIQPAANWHGAPMLVGTSYAIRTGVLADIGGIQPSITEDMATSFAILPRRNPATGHHWKGVYTPDLLAHGEGPASWGDFYKQQNRWARGAIEHMLFGPFVFQMLRMWRTPARVTHYLLLMAFYPVMGIVWLLGAANVAMFSWFGVSGAVVSPDSWFLFYGWASVSQMTLYTWVRRHNVSPYETSNSWGVYGMFMSVITAPVYANSLIKCLLRRRVGFDVTPKGSKSQGDSWFTFRLNLMWLAFYLAVAVLTTVRGYAAPATMTWPVFGALISAAPVLVWLLNPAWISWSARRHSGTAEFVVTVMPEQERAS